MIPPRGAALILELPYNLVEPLVGLIINHEPKLAYRPTLKGSVLKRTVLKMESHKNSFCTILFFHFYRVSGRKPKLPGGKSHEIQQAECDFLISMPADARMNRSE